MSVTLGDVRTALAYRLGEDSSPTNTNEVARRDKYIIEGYRKILAKFPTWFTEESATFNSVADQETYTTADGFPSDYRDMVELRVDDFVYTPIAKEKVFGLYDANNNFFNYDNLVVDKHWYIWDSTLHVLPAPSSSGTNNISIKYYKNPTMPSGSSDTFLVPEIFSSALDAFAYGRINQIKGRRGEAADGFNEFTDMLKDMTAEHNRQIFWNKSLRPTHPVYLVD